MMFYFRFLIAFILLHSTIQAQGPVIIGYWQNWISSEAPYIPLDQIDGRYDIVCVSFAVPTSPADMNMQFVPESVSQSTFIQQMSTIQAQGKKVLLSIGGANTSISMPDQTSHDAFINSMNSLLDTYPFDGIDIDIEHGNSILASGIISNPTSVDCVYLIDAITQIKAHYATTHSNTMMLTFAPETAYVQGGMSAYGGIWGGYLPILDALRDDINYIHVQLYNSGTVYGIDGEIYAQGTADFIVAMTEAMIQGFSTSGGEFAGFPEEKIVVGLPACTAAAGGGFCSPVVVASAIDYLHGNGNAPGNYTLVHSQGYPQLGGMMTWSINWDAVSTCNASPYEYVSNYEQLFETILSTEENGKEIKPVLFPNPANTFIHISNLTDSDYQISDITGKLIKAGKIDSNSTIEIDSLNDGFYWIYVNQSWIKFVKQSSN